MRWRLLLGRAHRSPATDHEFDLRTREPEIAERAVIERGKLLHRGSALAPLRIGAPPCARDGGGAITKRVCDAAHAAGGNDARTAMPRPRSIRARCSLAARPAARLS